MRQIFIDTNVVLDLLAKRKPWYDDAALLFSLADKGHFQIFVSSLTFSNISYVLSKLKTTEEARNILRRFRLLADVVSVDEKVVDLALNDSNFKDFEDGLQYYSALENNLEIIISRNSRDFKYSETTVMTPNEFLVSIREK